MANALPKSSTIAFFHNANGGNPEFLNLSQDRSLPDLDLSFIPRPFIVISACGGMILIRVAPAGSYYVFNPLYPSNVGLKRIPDHQFPHPAETPATVFLKPQEYGIVSAVCDDKGGYYFYKYSSYLDHWALNGYINLPGRKILVNTGVCWSGQAFWLTETLHYEIVCHDIDAADTKLIGLPVTAPILPGTRSLQLGIARNLLSLLVVENAAVRLYQYRVFDNEAYWTGPVYSVDVYRGGAEVESMNEHLSDQIVCRYGAQPLRFDSRTLEVLFLVDGQRFVLWKNVDEVTYETRVVTLIHAVQPENISAILVANAVPFVFNNTPPPAGAWPSSQIGGFTLCWN